MTEPMVRVATIGCVIPACNEEETIARVVDALLAQTRVPDVIHVVVSGTSDSTVKVASQFAGAHGLNSPRGEQFTEVFVHDIGGIPGRRLSALNYGYSLVEGCDYLLGVGGGAVAERHAVEHLEAEALADDSIGSVHADCGGAEGVWFTMLSTHALRRVMRHTDRATPWAADGIVSECSLWLPLEDLGFRTTTSPHARASADLPVEPAGT